MAAIASFLRHTPIAALQSYFDAAGIALGGAVNWNAPESEVARPLLAAVDAMDDAALARVLGDAERVSVIEVVAEARQHRDALARLFAMVLLQQPAAAGTLPPRRYNLWPLTQPHDFPTDPEDGIDSVRLVLLRLEMAEAAGVRVTLEAPRDGDLDLHGVAKRLLSFPHMGEGMLVPTRAKLAIAFYPERESRRGKMLAVTLTRPNGCDLKNRTERERLIGEKYLERWGLVQQF